MKKLYTLRAAIFAVIIAAVLCPLIAQDARIPGSEETVTATTQVRNGKLVFESKDGNYRMWFDSRLQVDAAMYFENKNAMSNGALFRRLTFALKTVLYKDWQAEFDVDFGEDVSVDAQTSLRDMWIQYTFPDYNLSLRVGNFKEAFGMERLNSSRLLTFLERSSPTSAFSLGRRIGASARYWTEDMQATLGIWGHEAGTRVDKGQRDEGYSTALRFSYAPINTMGHNLHLGAAGAYKIPDVTSDLSANTIEISSRTETYVFDPKFLHSNDIKDVNYYNRYAGELVYINGPFYMQAEYLAAHILRWYGKPAVNLKGGYLTATWMLTGESRYYYADEGEVGPTENPKNPFGAVELAARYSITNLNDFDAGVKGGQSNQLMLGVNFYPNANIKLQFNYSYVNLDQFANRKGNLLGDDDHSFIQMRFQASM